MATIGPLRIFICLLVVDCTRAVKHFGFYYPAAQVGGVANYSTCAFVDNTWKMGGGKAALDIAALKELEAHNLTAVLASIYGVVFHPSNATLKSNYTEEWAAYWSLIAPYENMITAFYPVDEPSPTLLANGDYKAVVSLLKKTAPEVPIAAVVTASAGKQTQHCSHLS